MSTYWDTLEKIIPEGQREQIAKKLTQLIRNGWGGVAITAKDHHLLDVRLTEIEPILWLEQHECASNDIDDNTAICKICGKSWRNSSLPGRKNNE